ncbi:MAG: hypothetical protein K5681_02125 [Treponema sp.]|nr:hypothetical protein [Treponema sp.]
MKRLAVLIITAALFCTSVFSKGFFEKRFFEYKMSVPVSFSNNLIALNDIMKEEVVIDLKKMAENLPNDGFALNMAVKPNFGINLNIAAVTVGVCAGLDVYGKVNLSKGLFDFLGTGMQVGDTLDITLSPVMDIYAYSEVNVGIKFSRFNLYVRPAVFSPIVSISESSGGISIVNNEDGSITMSSNVDVGIYSFLDLSQGFENIDIQEFAANIYKNLGFDLAMGMSMPFSKSLVVSADARIPIVPATMKNKYSMLFESETTLSLSDTSSFNFEMPSPEFNPSSGENYKLNRPLRVLGYVDFYPLGNFVDLRLGGGIGIYHPFMSSAKFYPQYYAGITFNLINILKASLSTEYTEQVFIHQLGAVVNIRLVEIDAGISMQSTDFAKSWLVSGFGAYLVVCVGF